jgi:hypothetical protein
MHDLDFYKNYVIPSHSWLFPLLLKGNRRDLEFSDIDPVTPGRRSNYLFEKVHRIWCRKGHGDEHGGRNPTLASVLFRAFGLEYMALGLAFLIKDCVLRYTFTLYVS